MGKGVKRKFESNTGDGVTEKERSLGILESITNKSAKLNIEAAVNTQIFREDQERRTEKEKGVKLILPTKEERENLLARRKVPIEGPSLRLKRRGGSEDFFCFIFEINML